MKGIKIIFYLLESLKNQNSAFYYCKKIIKNMFLLQIELIVNLYEIIFKIYGNQG